MISVKEVHKLIKESLIGMVDPWTFIQFYPVNESQADAVVIKTVRINRFKYILLDRIGRGSSFTGIIWANSSYIPNHPHYTINNFSAAISKEHFDDTLTDTEFKYLRTLATAIDQIPMEREAFNSWIGAIPDPCKFKEVL